LFYETEWNPPIGGVNEEKRRGKFVGQGVTGILK
jgi:hypothetical protein